MSMHSVRHCTLAMTLLAAWIVPAAQAENALGLYASGALGQASVASDSWSQAIVLANPSSFRENNGAWAARIGVRPIPLFAAEAEYYDFGNPSASVNATTSVGVKMKGTGVYGLVFLPIPFIDLYAKAGMAHMRTSTRITFSCTPTPGCAPQAPVGFETRDTSLAYGAGLQFKVGDLGVRGEYQRFSAAGAHPGLATLGLSFEF
jgi:opacity protein-like surface antigen